MLPKPPRRLALKSAIYAAGLDQNTLAGEVGITPHYLSRIVCGYAQPSRIVQLAIERRLRKKGLFT